MNNWRFTYTKSIFILILLWGPLFTWAVTGMWFIVLFAFFFPVLDNYSVSRVLYNYGFLVVHLLSVIVLSRYIKEYEVKVSTDKTRDFSVT